MLRQPAICCARSAADGMNSGTRGVISTSGPVPRRVNAHAIAAHHALTCALPIQRDHVFPAVDVAEGDWLDPPEP